MIKQTTFEVTEHMKSILGRHKLAKKPCVEIASDIKDYLEEIKETMSYNYIPTVKVEEMGGFITVNFFNNKDKRLDTVGDMLYYMHTGSKTTV